MKERGIIMSGDNPKLILDESKTQTRRIVADKRLSPKLTLLELFDFLGGGGRCDTSDEDGLRVSFVRDYDRQDDDGRRYRYTGLLVQSEAVPGDGAEEIECPYGVAGDRLWVRETHYRFGKWVKNGKTKTGRQRWCFKITEPTAIRFEELNPYKKPKNRTQEGWYKRPSIFMPKSAARLWLEITRVRVERVQDISEEDAIAEGLTPQRASPAQWINRKEPLPLGTAWSAPGGRTHYPPEMANLAYRDLWDSLHGKGAWERNDWVWVLNFKLCR